MTSLKFEESSLSNYQQLGVRQKNRELNSNLTLLLPTMHLLKLQAAPYQLWFHISSIEIVILMIFAINPNLCQNWYYFGRSKIKQYISREKKNIVKLCDPCSTRTSFLEHFRIQVACQAYSSAFHRFGNCNLRWSFHRSSSLLNSTS